LSKEIEHVQFSATSRTTQQQGAVGLLKEKGRSQGNKLPVASISYMDWKHCL